MLIELFIPNGSTFGSDIDFLFDLITYIVGFWFILVQAIIFYFIFRFRKKPGVKAQYISGEEHHETKWLHWPHYLVIVCDVIIIVITVRIWLDVKMDLPPPEDKIRVVAQQWTWIFVHSGPDGKLDTEDDVATVNDLHLKVNTLYHYELQSRDVLHDFSIPILRLKQDAIPGRTITGWFEPILTGQYDVQCAEMCGIGHGLMAARVTIESEESYNEWLASHASPELEEAVAVAHSEEKPFTRQLKRGFE